MTNVSIEESKVLFDDKGNYSGYELKMSDGATIIAPPLGVSRFGRLLKSNYQDFVSSRYKEIIPSTEHLIERIPHIEEAITAFGREEQDTFQKIVETVLNDGLGNLLKVAIPMTFPKWENDCFNWDDYLNKFALKPFNRCISNNNIVCSRELKQEDLERIIYNGSETYQYLLPVLLRTGSVSGIFCPIALCGSHPFASTEIKKLLPKNYLLSGILDTITGIMKCPNAFFGCSRKSFWFPADLLDKSRSEERSLMIDLYTNYVRWNQEDTLSWQAQHDQLTGILILERK